jgi:hypothetical protein
MDRQAAALRNVPTACWAAVAPTAAAAITCRVDRSSVVRAYGSPKFLDAATFADGKGT